MSMAQLSCVSRGPGSPDRHRRSQAWHRLGRYDSAKSRKRKRVFSRPLIDTDSSLSIRTPRVNVCLLPDPIIRRWTQMSADGEPLTAFICVHLRHLRIRPSVRTRRVNVRSVRDPIIRRWTDVCRRVSDHPRSETLLQIVRGKSGGSHLRFLHLRKHLTGCDFSIVNRAGTSVAQLSCVSGAIRFQGGRPNPLGNVMSSRRKILRILEQRHVEIEERWRQHRRG